MSKEDKKGKGNSKANDGTPKVSDEATKQAPKDRGGFPGNVISVAKDTFGEFMDDNCLNLSAAIAYYALQSVIPLILGIIAVGSLFLNDPQTRQSFITGIESAIPSQISATIKFEDIINGLIKGAGAAGFLSILTLLWTGSGIFDQFIFAINLAMDVKKDNRNFFVKLLLRFGMLIGLGSLLAAAFTITIILQILFNAKGGLLGSLDFILPVLSYLIPMVLEAAIFALLYKFSPARKGVEWKPVLVGAFTAAVLFEILKIAFTFYVTSFGAADSAAKTYGAIGGVIVFLLFLYLASAVILLGAEVTGTLSDFKSGMASIKTDEAVVEAPAENAGGAMVPQGTAPGSSTGRSSLANTIRANQSKAEEEFDYGTAENIDGAKREAQLNAARSGPKVKTAVGPTTFSTMQPQKTNQLTFITGAVILVFAAAVSALLRRKNPAA